MSAFYVVTESPASKVVHRSDSLQEAEDFCLKANTYAPHFRRSILTIPCPYNQSNPLEMFLTECAVQSVLYHGDGLFLRNTNMLPGYLGAVRGALTTNKNSVLCCQIIKNTCKALGIKRTWKAMREFAASKVTV